MSLGFVVKQALRSCSWHRNSLKLGTFLGLRFGSYVAKPTFISDKSKKQVLKFLKKDKIPDGYTLIYFSTVDKYLHWAQLLSVPATTIILSTFLYKIVCGGVVDLSTSSDFYFNSSFQVIFAFVSIILMTISVQRFASKSPLRIYSKGENYISVFNGFLGPLNQYQIKFQCGDCVKTRVNPLLVWGSAVHLLKDKKVILLESGFRTYGDYYKMINEK